MPSFVGSQGAALVTAAAVSGALILLLLRPKRMVEANQAADRRPSISSDKKGGKNTRILRNVQFATDVLEPSGDNEDYRRRRRRRRHDTVALTLKHEDQHRCRKSSPTRHHARAGAASYHGRKMPENQVVLYNGILRDRLQRTASMY